MILLGIEMDIRVLCELKLEPVVHEPNDNFPFEHKEKFVSGMMMLRRGAQRFQPKKHECCFGSSQLMAWNRVFGFFAVDPRSLAGICLCHWLIRWWCAEVTVCLNLR